MSIGVPIKILHEAEGHIVTCETNTGEVYRGKLIEAEDNMNCQVGLLIAFSVQTNGLVLGDICELICIGGLCLSRFFRSCVVSVYRFLSDVQYHCDASGWPCSPIGAGLYSGQQDSLPDPTGHVKKRPYVKEHEK
jgi:hypothetical protein